MRYLLLLLTLISFAANAQPDTGNRSIVIPPPSAPPVATPEEKPSTTFRKPFELPSTIKDPDAVSPRSLLNKPDNGFSMTKKNDFKNPVQHVEDKMNKRGEGQQFKEFRKNQYLGDVKTGSKLVRVSYRDFGEVDGDQIRVWVNDKIIRPQVTLGFDFEGLEIVLEPGFNKIDFEALTEGYASPNTAEFRIYDELGKVISTNQWGLGTGFKATIIVVKE